MVAMTTNFALKNTLTYRDKRRRGAKFLTGLISLQSAALGLSLTLALPLQHSSETTRGGCPDLRGPSSSSGIERIQFRDGSGASPDIPTRL